MNQKFLKFSRISFSSLLISGLFAASTSYGQGVSNSSPESSAEKEEVVVLSPFVVSTDEDNGYKVTNAISGTRLATSIKDLPMPLEVITGQFIRDTGSIDLRESLRFSAGIQLESQNDYLGNGNAQYDNPGGVNSPGGETADKTNTAIVIRGFTTNNALRDGFRRKVSTDAVNISRVEVVRGPAALLYGIGNFGGVVNYLVKAPEAKRAGWVDFTAGSHDLYRGTFDLTGPLAKDSAIGDVNFRLSAAVQSNGNQTDFYQNEKFAIAPIVTIRPWESTEFTIDAEYGESDQSGVGFQSLRGRADITNLATGQGGLEHAGFLTFPDQSLRTMRWSGPDTFLNSEQGNLLIKMMHQFSENLNLLVGFNHSKVTFESRDVVASLTNNIGPTSLWSTVTPVPLDAARGDTDANWTAAPMPRSIVAYNWADATDITKADQARVELSYKFDLFEDRGLLSMKNHFLLGVSSEVDESTRTLFTQDAAAGIVNYKSAADSSPFQFDTQGDGTPSLPLKLRQLSWSEAKEEGAYLVYQGRFLNDKITLLGGARRDRNSVATNDTDYNYSDGSINAGGSSAFAANKELQTTVQGGVSFTPIKELSFFAMYSEGLNPNFEGHRDLSGTPMKAVRAENTEFGVKLDLFNGRISGTISHYDIERTGQPNTQFWWAPQTAVQRFDPTKPTVFNVTDMNPDAALVHRVQGEGGTSSPLIAWSNNYAWFGDLSQYSSVPDGAQGNTASAEGLQSYQNDGLNGMRTAIQSNWAAAKNAGAVSYWDAAGAPIDSTTFATLVSASGPSGGYTTLNASTAEGAAYMDSVFNYTRNAGLEHPGSDNWPGGFFWNPAPASTGYNIATLDGNSWANAGGSLAAPQTDRNSGWDGQLVLSPTDNWQVLFSFSKNDHEILSLGQFPEYPNYENDRWTPWLFPNGQWGLSGYYGENQQYVDESDSSTFAFKGLIIPGAQGLDYPKSTFSVFTNYRFEHIDFLKGLTLGGGAIRTGPTEYASGYTHGGDQLNDSNGEPLVLYTDSRWSVNLFGRYEFDMGEHPMSVQVNVENLLDDQSRYGHLWAPGRTVRFTVGTSF
jgi:iron complex outermembrane receptor protein